MIIRGSLRQYHIKQPKIKDLRVTPYTVRNELIKTISYKLPSSNVLDLFAGSGSLGLDSISCGARSATFVDIHEDSVRKIRETLKALNLVGRGRVHQESCEKYLSRALDHEYDIVFFTPPYENLHLFLLPRIRRIIKDNGLLIVEHPPSLSVDKIGESSKTFNIIKTFNFGWSRLTLLSPNLTNGELTGDQPINDT